MKIIVIGATGTLGRAVVAGLGQDNEVISVALTHGDLQVDVPRDERVEALFAQTGRVDAIIATTGSLFFGPLTAMRAEDFAFGLNDKLLGQVRLSLIGQHYLNDGGSITLTSGIIGSEPIAQGVNATAVNAALEGFVRAAACELPRGLRINVVSPTVLSESVEKYGAFFPGFESVPAARAALAYRRSVYGVQTGRTFTVGY